MNPITTIHLPATGYLRLSQIVGDYNAEPPVPGLFPINRSTWWRWVKLGRAPKGVKLGPNARGHRPGHGHAGSTGWRVEDIRRMIEEPGKTWAGEQKDG